MAISNQTSKIRSTGDGVTTGFDFSYKVFAETDIEVYLIDTSATPNTSELKVLNTDYTVTLNTVTEGGTVTMNTAPVATEDLLIVRVLEYTQPTEVPTESNIPETQLENSYDRSVMLIQQVKEITDRSAKLSQTSDISSVTLPDPVANKALLWDEASGALKNSQDDFDDIVTNAQAAQTAAEAAQSAAQAAQTGAQNAQTASEAARDTAQEWATNTSSLVETTDYSSKEYAIGILRRGVSGGGSAKDWATYVDGNNTVDNSEFSAKYYAQQAATSVLETAATQTISASGDINHTATARQYRRVVGNAGAVTTSTTPFGTVTTNFTDGMEITLVGTSDTNTVTVPFADTASGALLFGDAVLRRGYILTLIYDATLLRFLERSRNF